MDSRAETVGRERPERESIEGCNPGRESTDRDPVARALAGTRDLYDVAE